MSKWKIPFEYMPGSWGLKGKTRQIAKAEYELEGYDLEVALAKLNIEDTVQLKKKMLGIDLVNKKITMEDFEKASIDIMEDSEIKELAKIEFEYKYNGMKQNEYDKRIATLKNEPWVSVLSMDFGESGKPSEGSFELDWNDQFLEKLKKEGYSGHDDESIINLWFMEVCKNVAVEQYGGVGTFDEDVEAAMDSVGDLPKGRRIAS